MNSKVTDTMLKQMESDLRTHSQAIVPALRDEKLGPLASEAILKMTSEAASSLETIGEELKDKVHELSAAIVKMNEETARQLTELDSLMKSAMMSIANTRRAVQEDGASRAKMIAEVAESLRRVDQQCQSMKREINGGEPVAYVSSMRAGAGGST